TGLYAAEWPGRWIHAAALAARAPGVAGPAHGGFCIAPRQLLDSSRLPGIGMAAGNGSLSCVGLGMMLGAHIGPRARATIEQADVVFGAVSDPLVELWLQQMNADVRSLQPYYAEGKSRHDTYREMIEAMLAQVRAGRQVCGAFYGHP